MILSSSVYPYESYLLCLVCGWGRSSSGIGYIRLTGKNRCLKECVCMSFFMFKDLMQYYCMVGITHTYHSLLEWWPCCTCFGVHDLNKQGWENPLTKLPVVVNVNLSNIPWPTDVQIKWVPTSIKAAVASTAIGIRPLARHALTWPTPCERCVPSAANNKDDVAFHSVEIEYGLHACHDHYQASPSSSQKIKQFYAPFQLDHGKIFASIYVFKGITFAL